MASPYPPYQKMGVYSSHTNGLFLNHPCPKCEVFQWNLPTPSANVRSFGPKIESILQTWQGKKEKHKGKLERLTIDREPGGICPLYMYLHAKFSHLAAKWQS
ncbi:hypothetical protein Bbelb_342530 [Branchiostoma belcheri]|nr:hypothetical protein Bbelb_342530 [Branchiostoma belcheri]